MMNAYKLVSFAQFKKQRDVICKAGMDRGTTDDCVGELTFAGISCILLLLLISIIIINNNKGKN